MVRRERRWSGSRTRSTLGAERVLFRIAGFLCVGGKSDLRFRAWWAVFW